MGMPKLIRTMTKKVAAQSKTIDAVKTRSACAVLDHPQRGEKITAPQYTFRVGTLGDIARVVISIEKGSWQPCRYSIGYWWYDWAGYTEGRYQAEVRAWTKDGTVVASGPSKFQVVFGTGVRRPK